MEFKKRKTWLAALSSILSPGLGHFYCGAAKRGIIILFALLIVYLPIACPVWYVFNKPYNIVIFIFIVVLIYSLIVLDAIFIANKISVEYELKPYNKWYYYLAYILIATFVLKPMFALPVKIHIARAYYYPSSSMTPTLLQGDHIISNVFIYKLQDPKRGDIVVFKYPKDETKEYVKRIVGVGGDIVEIRSKKLYINNELVDEPYKVCIDSNVFTSEQNQRDNFKPFEVTNNHYFVLGDNRDNSNDSRFFGLINRDLIKGKVSSIYFSWDSNNFKFRLNRIGNTF